MMFKKNKAPAFTLLEMLIAITVFSIFIGFVVSAYLNFHRADQEALVIRSLVMEGGQVMDLLTTELKTNGIDYDYYTPNSEHYLNETALVLRSLDGLTRSVYFWDSTEKTFTVQKWDMSDETNPLALDGYLEPLPLTSDHVYLNAVEFRIFPNVDPYDSANTTTDELQFQPVVTMKMTFAALGRVREEVTLPLQTTVTLRQYQ